MNTSDIKFAVASIWALPTRQKLSIAGIAIAVVIGVWMLIGSIHNRNYQQTIGKLKANEQAARIEQAKAQSERDAAKIEAVNAKDGLNEANQELENLRAETDRLRAVSNQSVRFYESAKSRPTRRTVISGDISDNDIRAAIERARAANPNAATSRGN